MQHLRTIRTPHHRVIVKFEGSSVTFPLPREATFADLADRLASLWQSHRGAPIGVAVTFDA